MGYNKRQLVQKLSGQFDRISGKIRDFRDKLNDTAHEDYTNYVKQFISDEFFNDKGTLNKGTKNLSQLSTLQLRKLFLKTIAIGESPVMKTVRTYTKHINDNERDIKGIIQTQMEQLHIPPEIIDDFINDPVQVFRFREMLKIHSTPYEEDILKTMTEYAHQNDREMKRNIKRVINTHVEKLKTERLAILNNKKELISRQIARGDYRNAHQLEEIYNEMDSIRGNDIR